MVHTNADTGCDHDGGLARLHVLGERDMEAGPVVGVAG